MTAPAVADTNVCGSVFVEGTVVNTWSVIVVAVTDSMFIAVS